MDWVNCIKTFSADYANAVTALTALGALILAGVTLWFLKREFSAKYRPYVIPIVDVEKIQESLGCMVSIVPRNVGPHPCRFKLTKIRLHIGDETYETPDIKEWMLLAPQGVGLRMPAGHVNDAGVKKIREARYKNNHIEVSFTMHTTSIENKFNESKSFCYEINVLGETPQALFRPEWQQSA
jgi:hypothetical protein